MNERAAWILVVLLTATVGWYRLDAAMRVVALERVTTKRMLSTQAETIGALRSAMRDAKTVALAAHEARVDCEQGLGLAALRQHWLDKELGLSARKRREPK